MTRFSLLSLHGGVSSCTAATIAFRFPPAAIEFGGEAVGSREPDSLHNGFAPSHDSADFLHSGGELPMIIVER